ncbi:hypothetical protein AMTRI_Chr06g197320 [Amborella trichopoda]|uniref:uncharacterized protein LOC110007342 n=1 Tax=Amborella trichopoda TaxID=13333 RepID=UPI0009C10292|nr:uncharacterized protein LOC110007342 [Amborella trichopoda]|eukprot:XP_020523437.1 uncharacterized protein LOC110007342 [Amborella trichopoda]
MEYYIYPSPFLLSPSSPSSSPASMARVPSFRLHSLNQGFPSPRTQAEDSIRSLALVFALTFSLQFETTQDYAFLSICIVNFIISVMLVVLSICTPHSYRAMTVMRALSALRHGLFIAAFLLQGIFSLPKRKIMDLHWRSFILTALAVCPFAR